VPHRASPGVSDDQSTHSQADIALLGMASGAQVMPTPVFGGVQGSLEQHIGEKVTYVGFGARNNQQPPRIGAGGDPRAWTGLVLFALGALVRRFTRLRLR
jgi:hypothetical protein